MPDPQGGSRKTPSAELRTPWRTVAYGAGLLFVVSTASLIVVASLRHTETLATVALSLAVVAFLVQIVVFLGQTAAQEAQQCRTEDLHSRMIELLADIREASHQTQEAMKEQRDFLLPALLAKVDLQRPPDSGPTSYAQAADEIEAEYPPRVPSPDDPRIAHELATYPRDRAEAERIAAALSELSEQALVTLARLATDERGVRSSNTTISHGLYLYRSAEWNRELVDHGLITPLSPPLVDIRDPAREYFVLTEEGRQLGRVLIATEPLPPQLEGLEFPRPAT